MRVGGVPRRSIWLTADERAVAIIDQTVLPHRFVVRELTTLEDAVEAIRVMRVRGAPLIGVTAAYGVALAMREDPSDAALARAAEALCATRPTAVNLRWAVEQTRARLMDAAPRERAARAMQVARDITEAELAACAAIGRHGAALVTARARDRRVEVLTHCNAGWLATVDYGTALAPLFAAHDAGVPLHVWVDETRPRNQGASLTAWELAQHGVPHTLIADNSGGHLMQHGRVDLCIVGADRITAQGDVCNKIGTYLKALAAHDNGVPFWVAAPGSSIDFSMRDGLREIPIEERSADEVLWVHGVDGRGEPARVRIAPEETPAANFAFDVTPARLVTGFITERGVAPDAAALRAMFHA